MPSKSTKLAFNEIMEALQSYNVNMIGLNGMGGLGKTTLAKEVGKKAKELKLFDQVVMVVLSQTPDLIKIQDRIAEKLGLQLSEQTKEGRAERLWSRLINGNKILIILDDIWEPLDWEPIGIPHGDSHKGCKILVTTRKKHVCHSLECQRQILLEALNEDETWDLFKKKAGLRDDSTLNNMAMKVAKECKGLPLAIVTLGRALIGKSLIEWEVACKQPKSSQLKDIHDAKAEETIYGCFKLSYDYLRSKASKICFLLCSLYPQDYGNPIEQYWLDLQLGWGCIQKLTPLKMHARRQVLVEIKFLKDSCMLLETESEDNVKMHDVVRDFALWIGSHEENAFMVKACIGLEEWPRFEGFQNYTAISLMDSNIGMLLDGIVCPKLELLLARWNSYFM